MTTMRNDVVYEVSVNGADEAARTLGGMAQRTAHGVGMVADNIKLVGKDLDNLGLNAGKTFAMTAEGALSVVAALGTGGVAGVVGAVTVGVGALVTMWANEKQAAADAAKAAGEAANAHKKLVDEIAAGMAKRRAAVTMETLVQEEDQLNARRLALGLKFGERALAQARILTARGTDERLAAIKERDRLEAEIAKEQADIRATADDIGRRKNLEAAKEARRAEIAAAEEAAEAAKKAAEIKKKAEEDLNTKRDEIADAAARRAAWENEQSDKFYRERYAAERKAIEDKEKADEDAAKKAAEKRERDAEKAADAEKKRREEIEKTTKALREKQQADAAAAMAAAYSTQVNLAFGVSSTVVQPVISELTGTIRQLGDVNRETYQDFVLFSDELPAIIAKKTQAILGGIAAEATGKSLQSVADSAREFALGSGLIAIPGMQAQAAGHFTASAAHMVAASAYAAIGGGAAAGAIGIGAMRGGGGPIPLTREEQDRNASRDRNRGGGGGSLGGGSRTSMGAPADGGAFVVNIAYQAGSIAPADEARAARTVASATRRARSNAFDRRRMEG